MSGTHRHILRAAREGSGPPPSNSPPEAPFECVAVHGDAADNKLTELRRQAGVFPVLLGDRENFNRVLEMRSVNQQQSFEQIRDLGLKLDVADWIKERVGDEPGIYTVDERETMRCAQPKPLVPACDLLNGRPKAEVFIGLIPVVEQWLVPAYLRMGNWNNCPPPEAHVAFFHRWADRYRASLTTASADVVEFRVERPPRTRAAARELAWEHFVYCDDIVHQGAQTLGNLTVSLKDARNWYFWWD